MKKLLSAFYALALTTIAHTGIVEAGTSVQFGIGYRSDDINWKVKASEDVAPDTYSHLNFRDLEIFSLQAKLKGVCGDCVYYRIDGQYGWVLDGTVRESDQFAVDTTPAIGGTTIVDVHTHNDVKRNYVADFNVGVGYPLQNCWCPELQIVPTIGFAYDTQRLRAKNHNNIIDQLTIDQINAIGLSTDGSSHSKFRSTWWGPYVGIDLAFCHQDCWNLYGEFEYHFGTRARRERNSDTGFDFFDSYERTKHASGFSLKFGSTYSFCCNWFADAHITYKRFTADDHDDKMTWRTIGVAMDIGYVF
jgi:Protochlamydia outer membrane protein